MLDITRRETAFAEALSRLGTQKIAPVRDTNLHANIRSFTVDTDSVVANATVITDGVMKRILIDWGDGTTSTLKNRPGIPVPLGQGEPLPQGTYKLSHAYAAPEDRKPFDYFVLARVDDDTGVDFRIQKITLTPRYRVTNYRTRVRLSTGCDSVFESTNEFDVTQLVDSTPVNQWHWGPSNSVFDESFTLLEGSMVSRELTVADGAVSIVLDFYERDPVYDEHLSLDQSINALQDSASIEVAFTATDWSCDAVAQYDRDVSLIVPLPPGPTLDIAPS